MHKGGRKCSKPLCLQYQECLEGHAESTTTPSQQPTKSDPNIFRETIRNRCFHNTWGALRAGKSIPKCYSNNKLDQTTVR